MFDVVVLRSPDVLAQFGGVSVLLVVKCCDMILYLTLNLFSVSPMYVSVLLLPFRVTEAW